MDKSRKEIGFSRTMLSLGGDKGRGNKVESDQYTHDIRLNDMRKTKPENYKAIRRIKTYSL